MKILFTHSYFLQFDPKQVQHAQPYAPLGTLLAVSCAREKGHEVFLFDTMFAQSPEELIPFLDRHQPEVLVIYDDGFNYLTKMCLSNMRHAAMRMQELARERGCKVIVSSSDSSDHYQKYLGAGADFVILGEGENTLLELLSAIAAKESSFERIRGLAFQAEGDVRKTAPRAVSRELDGFPMPAWDLVDMDPYKKVWEKRHGFFSINAATTRGCPYSCNWCAKPIYGNAYHMRSPANVVAELEFLQRSIGFDHVWFCDDIFGLKRSWVTEFASLVKKSGLRFKFKIQSRADLLVQERYVEDLAAAGCDDVWMGAESGSQRILDAMDKGTKVEQIVQARALLRKHGIKASFFLQFGYPGESETDIKKTIDLVKQNMPDDIGISVSYPLPGTVFYQRVKDELKEKQNWDHSDELAMMFRNTFPPSYYKSLHRLVHSIYRSKKAAQRFRNHPTMRGKVGGALSFFKNVLAGGYHRTRLKIAKSDANR